MCGSESPDVVVMMKVTELVSYTTCRGNTMYGPVGLGQYLISSYL